MTVINIADHKPHLSGEMKCLVCGHLWVGVCPIDPEGRVPCMKCPECGLHQGFYIYPCLPGEGDEVYTCKCSGEIFTITKRGARCIRCGLLHQDF